MAANTQEPLYVSKLWSKQVRHSIKKSHYISFFSPKFCFVKCLSVFLLMRRNGSPTRSWTSRPSWTLGPCRRAFPWSLWRSEVARSGSVRSATSRPKTPPSQKGKAPDSRLRDSRCVFSFYVQIINMKNIIRTADWV